MTTSLRGIAVGNLKAHILTEGVHSGAASGVVPSSFRILRQILDRLEDASTGQVIPDFLYETHFVLSFMNSQLLLLQPHHWLDSFTCF